MWRSCEETEIARFKWVGHKNELCFLSDTLVDMQLEVLLNTEQGEIIVFCFFSSEHDNENDNIWGLNHIFKIEEALWGNWQQLDTISFHCNERTTFN